MSSRFKHAKFFVTKNQHIFTLGISTKKKHKSMLLMTMETFLAITKLGKRILSVCTNVKMFYACVVQLNI